MKSYTKKRGRKKKIIFENFWNRQQTQQQNQRMSFFRTQEFQNVIVDSKSSKLMICMDNSGSTSGRVLEQQKFFARSIMPFFSTVAIVKWDTFASRVSSLDQIQSAGGTEPICTVGLISETNPDFLLFMTDGQVGRVDEFRAALLATTIQCPTIVCLTVEQQSGTNVSSFFGVNMSIVEAFMSASQDVAIVLNFCNNTLPLLFNGTGLFSRFVAQIDGVADPAQMNFDQMSKFSFPSAVAADEKTKTFTITLRRTSRSVLYIESLQMSVDLTDFDNFLSKFLGKDAVFDIDSEEKQMQLAAIFDKLCERMVLPKIDPSRYLALLHGLSAAIERKQKQKQIQEKEFQIVQLKMMLALSKHQVLIAALPSVDEEEVDAEKPACESDAVLLLKLAKAQEELQVLKQERETLRVSAMLIKSIDRLRTILMAYKQDKTKFTYEMGSTRASSATEIDANSLLQVGKCARGECPVLLETSDLCMVLQLTSNKKPTQQKQNSDDDDDDDSDGDAKEQSVEQSVAAEVDEEAEFQKAKLAMVSHCTRDIFIDSALMFGAEICDVVTPGAVSLDFAKQFQGKRHPLTNGLILGFVPLAYDLTVLRKHLCMLLCGGKEMFHVVPAFVAMVAKNMRQHRWTNPHVVEHARFVLNNLLVRCRSLKNHAAPLAERRAKIAEAKKPNGRRSRIVSKHTQTVKNFVKTTDINKEVTADEGVTLREAIQHQLTNYRTCLSQVAYTEARSMVNIAIQLMPEFEFPVAKVLSFIGTLNALRVVREAYVTTPWEIATRCVNKKTSVLRRMIAKMCFDDYFKNKSVLRGLKFQQFWQNSLEVPIYGDILTHLCNGHSVLKEEIEAFCLSSSKSPSFIDFQSKEYKKEFYEQLETSIADRKTHRTTFEFENVDVLANCVAIYRQCCANGKDPSLAMLLSRLQTRYGLTNPTIYSEIIQRQISIAIPRLQRLVVTRRSDRNRAFSEQKLALEREYYSGPWKVIIDAAEDKKFNAKVEELRKQFHVAAPKDFHKIHDRKQKRKEKKRLAKWRAQKKTE